MCNQWVPTYLLSFFEAEGIITTSRQHKAHDTKEQQRSLQAQERAECVGLASQA